jgi:predicted AAA+ superfamily ATPase
LNRFDLHRGFRHGQTRTISDPRRSRHNDGARRRDVAAGWPPEIDWNRCRGISLAQASGARFPASRYRTCRRCRSTICCNIERQKGLIEQNTRQFVRKSPANNVLLTGARGTGKSSLIKACLNAYHTEGLRLIEVDKDDLHDLGDIVDLISARPERFIVFCDDLSFEDGESGYKALKVALDGSISAQSDNVLIYATSNRRHLLPEYMSDNETYKHTSDGEIHPGEVVEEKISLSERFGLWVSFYPFKQDDYLTIVGHWLKHFGCEAEEIAGARGDALVWALERGSRSGRVAWQFARDWSGRKA